LKSGSNNKPIPTALATDNRIKSILTPYTLERLSNVTPINLF
jgi:hypothetical protein